MNERDKIIIMTTEILRIVADPSTFPEVSDDNKEAIVTIDHDEKTITYQLVEADASPDPNRDDYEFGFDDFEDAVELIREMEV